MENTALITGASSGIGLEFSKIFAREGYNLLLVARRKEKLLNLKNELESTYKVKVEVLGKDLIKKESAKEIYDFTKENNIKVEVLVNNAGFGDFGEFTESDLTKQEEMIEVNVTSLVKLTHFYLKEMKIKNSGKILNVASIAAFQPGPLMSVYYATKAFVLSFTEALSVEVKGSKILISALCPGPTNTKFVENADLQDSGLFKNLKNSNSKKVAEFGYNNLMKGKVVAVPEFTNKMLSVMGKISPRSLTRNITYLIQK